MPTISIGGIWTTKIDPFVPFEYNTPSPGYICTQNLLPQQSPYSTQSEPQWNVTRGKPPPIPCRIWPLLAVLFKKFAPLPPPGIFISAMLFSSETSMAQF